MVQVPSPSPLLSGPDIGATAELYSPDDLAPQKPFAEQGEDFWMRMIAMNLTSTLRACRAVLPGMMDRGCGRVITTGAVAGKIGGPDMALYSAVKGGVTNTGIRRARPPVDPEGGGAGEAISISCTLGCTSDRTSD